MPDFKILFESQQGIVEDQRERIRAQEEELQQLRATLKAFTENPDTKGKQDDYVRKRGMKTDTEIVEGSKDEDMEPDAKPLWVEAETLYRCSICSWEIIERECVGCGRDYSQWVCEEDPNGEPLMDTDWKEEAYDYELRCEDNYRMPTVRGTTPQLEVDPSHLRSEAVASGYHDRIDEYQCLLARGATCMMCDRFYLTYTKDSGIWLEMKDALFDEWAGPGMVDSETDVLSWKVCLGREIRLDEDGNDKDGSHYIDEFLEEALLLFGGPVGCFGYQTIEESPGHWVTKPYLGQAEIKLKDWKKFRIFGRNEYESDDSGDEDHSEDDFESGHGRFSDGLESGDEISAQELEELGVEV